jgi:hypothetical protein
MHARDRIRAVLHPLRVYAQVRQALDILDEQPAPVTQPAPRQTDGTPIWDLVIADMQKRDHVGRARYGAPLQSGNGRDALVDAYEEALDLCVYLRQAIEERK